jgi:hypothetical protein
VSEVLDEEGFTIGVNIIYVHGFSEDVVWYVELAEIDVESMSKFYEKSLIDVEV